MCFWCVQPASTHSPATYFPLSSSCPQKHWTPLMLHKWMNERDKKKRGVRKNDGVCLCQGLMRRVMPWTGCSVGPPWIPLVSKWACDVWCAAPLTGRTLLSTVSLCRAFVYTCALCINIAMPFLIFFHSKPYSLYHTTLTHLFLCLLQEHIFKLMKSDSYARFLRSNIYQDLLLARKKVSCTHWLRLLLHI